MKSLKEASSAMFARAREHRERPEMLESLRQALNASATFLEKSRNLSVDGGLFKEKELDALEKKIADVEKWRDEKVRECFYFSVADFSAFFGLLYPNPFVHLLWALGGPILYLMKTFSPSRRNIYNY
jgi:hypothetical protein